MGLTSGILYSCRSFQYFRKLKVKLSLTAEDFQRPNTLASELCKVLHRMDAIDAFMFEIDQLAMQ